MTYATRQALIDRIGERELVRLTDRAIPSAGAIDEAVVARALADADAMIDGYLARRYALPIVEVPTLLADLALSIAIYKLHVWEPDPKIVRDYEAAQKQLREIATGVLTLSLPGAGGEPAAAAAAADGARLTDRAREFTAENLRSYI